MPPRGLDAGHGRAPGREYALRRRLLGPARGRRAAPVALRLPRRRAPSACAAGGRGAVTARRKVRVLLVPRVRASGGTIRTTLQPRRAPARERTTSSVSSLAPRAGRRRSSRSRPRRRGRRRSTTGGRAPRRGACARRAAVLREAAEPARPPRRLRVPVVQPVDRRAARARRCARMRAGVLVTHPAGAEPARRAPRARRRDGDRPGAHELPLPPARGSTADIRRHYRRARRAHGADRATTCATTAAAAGRAARGADPERGARARRRAVSALDGQGRRRGRAAEPPEGLRPADRGVRAPVVRAPPRLAAADLRQRA